MKNGCCIEARACLDPLFGFYFAVAVEVGAEVAVPAKAAAGNRDFILSAIKEKMEKEAHQ